MQATLSFILLAAGLGSAAAQDAKIDRIEITETGIFQAATTATEARYHARSARSWRRATAR